MAEHDHLPDICLVAFFGDLVASRPELLELRLEIGAVIARGGFELAANLGGLVSGLPWNDDDST